MSNADRDTVEGFGAESVEGRMAAVGLDEIEQAEAPGIAEGEAAAVGEVQIQMVVVAFIAGRGEAPGAGHAEVAEQGYARSVLVCWSMLCLRFLRRGRFFSALTGIGRTFPG